MRRHEPANAECPPFQGIAGQQPPAKADDAMVAAIPRLNLELESLAAAASRSLKTGQLTARTQAAGYAGLNPVGGNGKHTPVS